MILFTNFLLLLCGRAVIGCVKAYQLFLSAWLSMWFPTACRFYPTCSNYMIESITTHGPLKGLFFGIKRIIKCNPFGPSGFDPVQKVNHET
ncbi:MAG: membrane protein insertion efficiency factor YidD [Methylacidiphilales bacterium]|nr:membrane protein insertion efficiency factor YidD [Candidatus Methylacidiphilales bacterium]